MDSCILACLIMPDDEEAIGIPGEEVDGITEVEVATSPSVVGTMCCMAGDNCVVGTLRDVVVCSGSLLRGMLDGNGVAAKARGLCGGTEPIPCVMTT